MHARLTPAESIRRGIQVIYQDLSLFPNLTVAENIAVERHLGGCSWSLEGDAAHSHGRDGAHRRRRSTSTPGVADLSIAQRQLVAICRAIADDAKLVIMDEPTASLTRHEVDALLGAHAASSSARASAWSSSAIAWTRSSRSRSASPCCATARRAAPTTPRDERPQARRTDDRQELRLRPVASRPHATRRAVLDGQEPVARRRLRRRVASTVRKGEILGITGLLGSGRTELALSLFGMSPPDAGEIRMRREAPCSCASTARRSRTASPTCRRTGCRSALVLPQPIASNITLTVLDGLADRFGLLDATTGSDHVAQWIDDSASRSANPENPVGTLSGGNQQRVVLAKWLATKPSLLILDSPTVGRRHRRQGRHLPHRPAARGERARGDHDLGRDPGGVLPCPPRAGDAATGGSIGEYEPHQIRSRR